MNGPNPNSKQMPQWLAKKMATTQLASHFYTQWMSHHEFAKEMVKVDDDVRTGAILEAVKLSFEMAEALDKYSEHYLKPPAVEQPTRPPLVLS